jgi:laccase
MDFAGVWFFHCHLERHVSWGMMMAFIIENGKGAAATLPGPKHSMPRCTTVSVKH